MDWFRWYNGSTRDPKFGLIAKRVGTSTAEVIAVWAAVLEAASESSQRGNAGEIDFDALDFLLGLQEGRAAAIYAEMVGKGLVRDDAQVSKWEKRQPKRERDDPDSYERVKAFRERKRHETPSNADETLRNASETPCNAKETLEEKREEKKEHPPTPRKRGVGESPPGFDAFWAAWPKRLSRGQAEKAFAQISPTEQLLAEILAGIERATTSEQWRREGGRFIPHASTWLRAKGWLDETGTVTAIRPLIPAAIQFRDSVDANGRKRVAI